MTKEEQIIDRDNYVKEQIALFEKYGIEEAEVPENDDDYYGGYRYYLEIKIPDRWDKLTDWCFELEDWQIRI